MKKKIIRLSLTLMAFVLTWWFYSCFSENKYSTEFSSINSESRDENIFTYYGGGVRIEISFSGSQCNVTRTFLGSNINHPVFLYNLTDISPANGKLTFNESDTYWFVPFDMNVNAQVIGGKIDCVAATNCNDCELTKDPNQPGCMICECKEGQATGPEPGAWNHAPAFCISNSQACL